MNSQTAKLIDSIKNLVRDLGRVSWEDGYETGYNEGLKEGYTNGLRDGYDKGYRDAERDSTDVP